MKFQTAFIAACCVLTGCAQLQWNGDRSSSREPSSAQSSAPINAADKAPANDVKMSIPIETNDMVNNWIHYFSVKDHDRFQRFLNRGELYRDVVESSLQENDLPPELYYLAMIESGFQTHANSRARAKGVWQFMAGTATRYGLRVDRVVDERQDPIRATEAAAKYLRDLHNIFGSWYLAMAAYNAGENRILRAVVNGKSRDFWTLVQRHRLPRETAQYVPKFLAVVIIGQDPERYGFTAKDDDSFPDVQSIEVPGNLRLSEISRTSGIPLATLTKINPQLRLGITPNDPYEIWVPTSGVSHLTASLPALANLAGSRRRMVASIRPLPADFHRVRRGESLGQIASLYKMSVGHLKRMNHLTRNRIYIGQRLRVKTNSYTGSKLVRYRVRRGDNLGFIAQRFNTTVRKIRRHNHLKRNKIYVGQVLKIVAQL